MTVPLKAPIPADEARRLEALRSYEILDTPAEKPFDELTRLASFICGTPVALMTLVDADRMWVKSAHGMDVKEIARDQALCSHCIASPGVMEIPDASRDPRFAGNPIVADGPRLRFYAGAPLQSPEGHSIGALCVVDSAPRTLTPEQREALETLSRHVMKELELRRKRDSLERDVAARARAQEALLENQTRLNLLIQIVRGVTSGMGSQAIIERTLKEVGAQFPQFRVLYGVVDATGKLRIHKSVQPEGMPDLTALEADLTAAPRYLDALRRKSVVNIEDVLTDERIAPLADAISGGGAGAILDIPVHHGEGLAGILCFDASEPHRWARHEIETLAAIGEHLSMTLRDDRTEQERRQTEDALRSTQARLGFLLSSAPVVLYTARPIGRYGTTWISETSKAILGDEPALFRSHPGLRLDRLHPEDRPRILSELSILSKLGYEVLEYRYQRPDGKVRWIRDEIKLVRDSDGTPHEIVGCMVDISDQREAEAKLRRRERDRHHSNKMEAIGRLAGGVAHDFNNLLTAITGYSDLVATKLPEGDPLAGHVAEIRKAGDRAAGLCRQLLAFSRKQVLRPEILDLNGVIGDIEAMLRRVIGEDVELRVTPGNSLLPVKVDRSQIEQVVLNLAANARDAMPRGGRLAIETCNMDLDPDRVRATPGLKSGPYVLLRVSDTGVGMEKEVLAHLFEPFFTTKAEGKGTGLGLSTVYGFVRQSGGHLEVASSPGEGTVFSIYLPHTPGDTPPAGQIETTKIPLIRGTERTLIVEDSDTVRHLARQILEFHGYTVYDAPDAAVAMDLFSRKGSAIDIVITDVVMPKMNGPELVAKLVALKPSLKVLYMSGYPAEAVDSERLVASGFSFIAKPFTPETLAQKVRKVLDSGG